MEDEIPVSYPPHIRAPVQPVIENREVLNDSLSTVSRVEDKLAVLEHLLKVMPKQFLWESRSALERQGGTPDTKFPVFLLWADGADLARLEELDGYVGLLLGIPGIKQWRNQLWRRLFSIDSKHDAVGALFECQVPIDLIRIFGAQAVRPYLDGKGPGRSPDLALDVGGCTFHFENTALSHDSFDQDQIDRASRGEPYEGSPDPSVGTLRVLNRLIEKDSQLETFENPVVCLGFADGIPGKMSIRTAIRQCFDSHPHSPVAILVFRWASDGFRLEAGPITNSWRKPTLTTLSAIVQQVWSPRIPEVRK